MSTKYKSFNEVPTKVLANRLEELSDCFNDKGKFEREFTRRIPAELDRDPDLVMSRASQLLLDYEKRIAELEKERDENRIKALEDLLTYPNHRFHGDHRLYYSEYSIKQAIEQLRQQAKGE